MYKGKFEKKTSGMMTKSDFFDIKSLTLILFRKLAAGIGDMMACIGFFRASMGFQSLPYSGIATPILGVVYLISLREVRNSHDFNKSDAEKETAPRRLEAVIC